MPISRQELNFNNASEDGPPHSGALCTSKSYWRPFWLLLGTKWALEKQKKLKKFKSIGQVFGNFDNRAEPLKSDKNGDS